MKDKFVKTNIYKSGTKKYYRDALQLIICLGNNYDGFKKPKGLKSLIDDMSEIAQKALKHDTLYFKIVEKKKIK